MGWLQGFQNRIRIDLMFNRDVEAGSAFIFKFFEDSGVTSPTASIDNGTLVVRLPVGTITTSIDNVEFTASDGVTTLKSVDLRNIDEYSDTNNVGYMVSIPTAVASGGTFSFYLYLNGSSNVRVNDFSFFDLVDDFSDQTYTSSVWNIVGSPTYILGSSTGYNVNSTNYLWTSVPARPAYFVLFIGYSAYDQAIYDYSGTYIIAWKDYNVTYDSTFGIYTHNEELFSGNSSRILNVLYTSSATYPNNITLYIAQIDTVNGSFNGIRNYYATAPITGSFQQVNDLRLYSGEFYFVGYGPSAFNAIQSVAIGQIETAPVILSSGASTSSRQSSHTRISLSSGITAFESSSLASVEQKALGIATTDTRYLAFSRALSDSVKLADSLFANPLYGLISTLATTDSHKLGNILSAVTGLASIDSQTSRIATVLSTTARLSETLSALQAILLSSRVVSSDSVARSKYIPLLSLLSGSDNVATSIDKRITDTIQPGEATVLTASLARLVGAGLTDSLVLGQVIPLQIFVGAQVSDILSYNASTNRIEPLYMRESKAYSMHIMLGDVARILYRVGVNTRVPVESKTILSDSVGSKLAYSLAESLMTSMATALHGKVPIMWRGTLGTRKGTRARFRLP